MLFIILPSDVDDPVWGDTNTRSSYRTTLAQPLHIEGSGSRASVYSVVYPKDWAFRKGVPTADSRFFVTCNLFKQRAMIVRLDQRVSHVTPQLASQGAIFAFLPEPAESNGESVEYVKAFPEYHKLLPGPKLRHLDISVIDSNGVTIDFKRGTVVVTLHII